MKIVELTFSLGRTIQVKPYEPMNIHYSAKAEVEIEDTNMGVTEGKIDEAYKKLEHLVTSQLTKKVSFFEKANKPSEDPSNTRESHIPRRTLYRNER